MITCTPSHMKYLHYMCDDFAIIAFKACEITSSVSCKAIVLSIFKARVRVQRWLYWKICIVSNEWILVFGDDQQHLKEVLRWPVLCLFQIVSLDRWPRYIPGILNGSWHASPGIYHTYDTFRPLENHPLHVTITVYVQYLKPLAISMLPQYLIIQKILIKYSFFKETPDKHGA